MRNSYGRRVIKPRGTLRKLKDYGGVIHDFDRMPSKVEEYGTPAAIFSESGTVSNLFWRGSEEGVHVGSRTKFSGRERRKPYKRIHVEFEGLYCDEFGEDGFTIDPLGKATIRRCGFRGRSDKGANGDRPGEDKFGQIDGGWLVLDGDPVDERVFERCVRALRGKANSVLDIRRADFTRCREAIKGDGDDNPKKGNPFFNGRAGPCLVWIGKEVRFWDVETSLFADSGCRIHVEKEAEVGKTRTTGGGKILRGSSRSKFEDEVRRMMSRKSNGW